MSKNTSNLKTSNSLWAIFIFAIFLGLAGNFLPDRTTQAQAINPNEKRIDYCIEFANIEDYPGYIFMAAGSTVAGKPLSPRDCISNYYGESLTIFAIKGGDYSATEKHIAASPKLLRSNMALGREPNTENYISPVGNVSKDHPLIKAVDVLKIEGVTSDGVKIRKLNVRYSYNDGITEELPYQNQAIRPAFKDAPGGSNSTDSSASGFAWWWLIFPIVALLTIAAFFTTRQKRPRP